LVLFTLSLAWRNIEDPIIAGGTLAATTMLLYRLKIELGISAHEEYGKLEAKLQRIEQLNNWTMVPVMVGLVGFIRKAVLQS
jgi:hypothetical protein